MTRVLKASILISFLITFDTPAFAQEPNWELEGHGGISFALGSSDGGTAMPAAGRSFTTVSGRPSRRVSSWFFGDGNLLLSQVFAQQFPFAATPTNPAPLDSILQGPLIEPGNGAVFGFRVGRRLSSRLIAELTVDRLPEVSEPEEAFNEYLAATERFGNLWRSVLPGPIEAAANFDHTTEGQSRLLATGALNFEFGSPGKLRPYVAGGAGIERRSGNTPASTISGFYRYNLAGVVEENDQVELTGNAASNRFVGVVGGGVRFAMSPRFGLRGDARVYLSGNRDETLLSTSTPPARILGTISGYFDTGTNPAIQLQSLPLPAPDYEVSFSGPQISNFRTFEGSGIDASLAVTMGVFWRF